MFSAVLLRALPFALALGACTGDKADDATTEPAGTTGSAETESAETAATPTTGPTPTTGASETGELPAGCTCEAGDPCKQTLCPVLSYTDEDEDGEPDDLAGLDASTTCALTAMRDGVAGRISWTSVTFSGQYSTHGTFEMFGDGTALRQNGGAEDLCSYIVDHEELGPLKPSQTFADCLAADVATRYGCVTGALAFEGVTICVEGEQNCDGV